jgi:ketosteroid isomerase-like protein
MSGEGEKAVARLQGLYERMARGELSLDPEIFDPDIEVIWAEGMADSTVDHGIEEFGATMRRLTDVFTELSFVAERFMPHRDKVLVQLESRGTGRATKLAVSRKVFHLWTFSGGRAARIEGFWDEQEDEALRAAGIDPKPEP